MSEQDQSHSPEQIAFTNYWTEVLNAEQTIYEVSSDKEVDEILKREADRVRRREELRWGNANLCETCRFIPGKCANPVVNKLAGKSKPIPKMFACPGYTPGEKLTDPPDIPLNERIGIVTNVNVREVKGREWIIVESARWNKKNNQYEMEQRGLPRKDER